MSNPVAQSATAGESAKPPILSYADSPLPVRADLEAAHQRVWQRLARPGTWFSGSQRVAIAAESRRSRNCKLCAERKAALSPFAVDGDHDSDARLPDGVVDVVHRLTTDPGRLTRKWYDQVLAHGIDDTAYVEAMGVVVGVVSIDMFCRAIGVKPRPLPEPESGEPLEVRPEGLKDEGCWPQTLPNGNDLYQGVNTPNVGRAMSLVPAEVVALRDLAGAQYVSVDEVPDPTFDPGRAITRTQIELVAGRTSALNQCFY